jgi:hypothetical protein
MCCKEENKIIMEEKKRNKTELVFEKFDDSDELYNFVRSDSEVLY